MPKDWSIPGICSLSVLHTQLSEVTSTPLLVDGGVTKFTQDWMAHSCTPGVHGINASPAAVGYPPQCLWRCQCARALTDRGANAHRRAHTDRGANALTLTLTPIEVRTHTNVENDDKSMLQPCGPMLQLGADSAAEKRFFEANPMPHPQSSDVAATTSSLNPNLPSASTEVRSRRSRRGAVHPSRK